MEATDINIEKIIKEEAIAAVFQPIISVKQKAIIGFEALSRGINASGETIPPSILFALASAAGTRHALCVDLNADPA